MASVELVDFRNYRASSADLSLTMNVLVGENGQGKTNFLEAIGVLSVARSLRGATDAEMIRWGAPESRLACDVVSAAEQRLEMRIPLTGRKQVAVDGAPLTGLSELIGTLCTVHLAPEAIDGQFRSPAGRRRMLDVLISQVDHTYLLALKRHRSIVSHLNALLKQARPRLDELELWERQLATAAAEIVRRRRAVLKRLEPAATECFSALFGADRLGVRLRSTMPVDDTSQAVEACAEALAKARPQALRSGFVAKGAHRDRVEVLLDGRDIESHASQGQIKAAYFAWKTAEGAVMEQVADARPVWLIDDPFSELDRTRALRLVEGFAGRGQVLLTTARDDEMGIDRWDCARWRVKNGTIRKA